MASVHQNSIINYKGFPINLEVISENMAEDCLKEIKELFFIEGRYSPIIRWCSGMQSDWPVQHRELFTAWAKGELRDAGLKNALKVARLTAWRDNISVCEMVPNERDFRYISIGAHIKDAGEMFREGASVVRSVEHGSSVAPLFKAACLGACALRGQPLLALFQTNHANGRMSVRSSMIAPVETADGRTAGFVTTVLIS